MLSKYRAAQSSAILASQLIITRGAKASTTKLQVQLLKVVVRASPTRNTVEQSVTTCNSVQDIENLGLQGQLVAVKHGFPRNWLFPRRLAAPIPILPKRKQKAWLTRLFEPVSLFLFQKHPCLFTYARKSGSLGC